MALAGTVALVLANERFGNPMSSEQNSTNGEVPGDRVKPRVVSRRLNGLAQASTQTQTPA
jgi:hypothetical protein